MEEVDLSDLLPISLSLDFLCYECEELAFLKQNKESQEKEKKLSYPEWSAQAVHCLHNLQMIMLKGNIASVKSHAIEDKTQQDPAGLVHVKCNLDIKGPASQELQALVTAMPSETAVFKHTEDWSLSMINVMHKLEMLILSGKLYEAGYEGGIVD